MGKIRVAIVGAGNWATYAHLPALRLLEDYQVEVIATASDRTAASAAARLDVPLSTGRAEDAIGNPRIDLVVVLARVPQHARLVHQAIAAGKHVYCEWPLGVDCAEASAMLRAAEAARVCHVVGLQRRMAPSVRWLRHLVCSGFIGHVRSVRLHVSEPSLHGVRGAAWAAFTADPRNFSHVFSIYGGHFLDVLNTIFGSPAEVSAQLVNQFGEIRVKETGEAVPSHSPDQLVMGGRYPDGAVLSVHIEGGKRHGSGLSLAVTGTDGDLLLSGSSAFRNTEDHEVSGAGGGSESWQVLPVPERFAGLAKAGTPAAVLEVAHVYEGLSRRMAGGHSDAATFADALRLHEQLEMIEFASRTGHRQLLGNRQEPPTSVPL